MVQFHLILNICKSIHYFVKYLRINLLILLTSSHLANNIILITVPLSENTKFLSIENFMFYIYQFSENFTDTSFL